MPSSPVASSGGSLFQKYSPPQGGYDETFDSNGNIRPIWGPFLEHLESLGSDEVSRRWNQADQQIARDGFTFNPFDAEGEVARPWALDAIPLILAESEWNQIAAGLEQRAKLYDHILRDIYGPQLLLREKLIPPEAVFGHPGHYPAYHTLLPDSRVFLHMFAADLARSPDGQWWVTGDRSRAPFGLGYVLENRIVTSRMLPQPFRQMNVHRLASFFIGLKKLLASLAPRFQDNPRIALWTKGPSSRAYFEDAYLARYLGYQLVEGGDLAVRENRVQIKTLGRLLPVEVLFRRLDDEDCDPVELDGQSMNGVAGLLEVVRSGNVAIANPLGSRLVESPIFMAFLPAICARVFGEELKVPSVATWWCGEGDVLKDVLERFDTLLIRRAYRMSDAPPIRPGTLDRKDREKLMSEMRARPELFVAQETVRRSTTPVWSDNRVLPWPTTIRGFVSHDGTGYRVLPGGLARVAPDALTLEKSMTTGEHSQDVWILSETPIEEVSLLNISEGEIALRRSGSELPSRVADNLFWLGRYVERAEGSARLLRTIAVLLMEESESAHQVRPLLRALAEQGQIDPDHIVSGLEKAFPALERMLPSVIADANRPKSLRSSIQQAMRLISSVRDRLAVDAWRILHRIHSASLEKTVDLPDVLEYLDGVILDLVSFSGLCAESMTRAQGWRFLDLGRRIERAWQTATLIRATAVHVSTEEPMVLESLLRTCDCFMTYRSRYMATLQTAPVLDLLVTDESNPRSISYQLAEIAAHVDELPRSEQDVVRTAEQRLALSLLNAVRLADVYEISHANNGFRESLDRILKRLVDQLPALSNAISSRFLIHAGLSRHFASAGASQ
ncbi:MAG: circularly permuted type 2 ATP-grasp protein [Planctomycetaceae bacterium]|nr:circularly permuted type 2 ATP-grasp protein [Planctomycetaceae bacterium]